MAMMLLTVADVVLRAVSNLPIRGTFEIIELLLACSFFLALPAVFLRDEHLLVDIVDPLAPRWVPRLRRIAEVIAIPVLALMAWEGFKAARETLIFNDVMPSLIRAIRRANSAGVLRRANSQSQKLPSALKRFRYSVGLVAVSSASAR